MQRKRKPSKAPWIDPDDGPPLTKEMVRRGQIAVGGKIVRPADGVLVNDRRGRPRMANPKQAIKLRLDADLLAHFRASGPGWQTRINTALRKAARLPARQAGR
ncbi:BrnA antitoxin of type II toxin-antitoxin system [Enhydrobacter aerosaccus]|uniref:BrnA antitoxin of type II toxin-antitoxin system n=1 Tax=Enhydrobacter aerosaccus TaxID=225324 RepID=A0A1T4TJ17_9HYPH|nr:BrnA antitoxin family protein [Enhydrobacter aerosaccus]SKA40443.1 BrnA antitoxin of type II toxin-antitoxin system [Enhydrobacter aerosaccus]